MCGVRIILDIGGEVKCVALRGHGFQGILHLQNATNNFTCNYVLSDFFVNEQTILLFILTLQNHDKIEHVSVFEPLRFT